MCSYSGHEIIKNLLTNRYNAKCTENSIFTSGGKVFVVSCKRRDSAPTVSQLENSTLCAINIIMYVWWIYKCLLNNYVITFIKFIIDHFHTIIIFHFCPISWEIDQGHYARFNDLRVSYLVISKLTDFRPYHAIRIL